MGSKEPHSKSLGWKNLGDPKPTRARTRWAAKILFHPLSDKQYTYANIMYVDIVLGSFSWLQRRSHSSLFLFILNAVSWYHQLPFISPVISSLFRLFGATVLSKKNLFVSMISQTNHDSDVETEENIYVRNTNRNIYLVLYF